RSPGGLGFYYQCPGLPLHVQLKSFLFQLGKIEAPAPDIEENDAGDLVLRVARMERTKLAPGDTGAAIGAGFVAVGGVPGLYDSFARRRILAAPVLPPFSFDDGPLFTGRRLLILGHPLGDG